VSAAATSEAVDALMDPAASAPRPIPGPVALGAAR
jgi:hypothetical protein